MIENKDFEPLDEDDGDLVKMDRLQEFVDSSFEWDGSGEITLDDISIAIHEALPKVAEPYGDTWEHPVLEARTREWHLGRILYFISHPDEIKDIDIDNLPCEYIPYLLPKPVIVDGWHRYAAAYWLYDQGKLETIHCRYGGRVDVLEYLQGKIDKLEDGE